jgi:hypothetical protein
VHVEESRSWRAYKVQTTCRYHSNLAGANIRLLATTKLYPDSVRRTIELYMLTLVSLLLSFIATSTCFQLQNFVVRSTASKMSGNAMDAFDVRVRRFSVLSVLGRRTLTDYLYCYFYLHYRETLQFCTSKMVHPSKDGLSEQPSTVRAKSSSTQAWSVTPKP